MRKQIFLLLFILFAISFSVFAQEDTIKVEKNAFLHKKVSGLSFRIGLSQKEVSNDRLLTAIDIEQIKNIGVSFAVSGAYFIADNVAWSAKVNYGFSSEQYTLSSKILNLLLDAEIYNTNIATSTFQFGTGVKNYVPIGNNKRFFIFNETNISYNYINSLTRDVYDRGKDIKKMFKTTHEISLGLSPGLMYFLKDGFAFEFAFNPIVIYYGRSFIEQDEEKGGSYSNFDIDLKLNILNIYFGFAYYFGTNKR